MMRHSKRLPRFRLTSFQSITIFFFAIIHSLALNWAAVDAAFSSPSELNVLLESLAQVDREFDAYLRQQDAFRSSYQRIANLLQETETAIGNLKLESVRQQTAAANTQLQALAFLSTTPAPTTTQRTTSRRARWTPENVAANNYRATVNRFNLDLAMRSEQVRQLSSTQQATLRKRLEAIQDLQKLHVEIQAWQQKYPTFVDEYWKYSDPENINSDSHNEAVLEVLVKSDDDNLPAKLTRALLELRLGRLENADSTLADLLEHDNPIMHVALAAKGLIHACKNQKQDAKSAMQAALKRTPKNPYVLWLRALAAAHSQEFGTAKKDFETLSNQKNLELSALRQMAIIDCIKPTKTVRDASNALKNAELAFDLSSSDDFYSHLVMAVALKNSGNATEAIDKARRARELASDTQVVRCDHVIEWINDSKPLEWKFLR